MPTNPNPARRPDRFTLLDVKGPNHLTPERTGWPTAEPANPPRAEQLQILGEMGPVATPATDALPAPAGHAVRFTCDLCDRTLIPGDSRYLIQMAVSPIKSSLEAGRGDPLAVEGNARAGVPDVPGEPRGVVPDKALRFDLCEDCRRRFLADPLGRKAKRQPSEN